MFQFSIVLTLVLCLAGCRLEFAPVVAADLYVYESGRPTKERKLSQKEMQALSRWLDRHRSGWRPSFVSYAPQFLLSLSHADGKVNSMNIMQTTIVVIVPDGQKEQHFTEQELDVLRKSLGAE